MDYRNPSFTESGLIDCEIDHPDFGWIPFTVNPLDDRAGFDVAALDAAIRVAGGIAAYVPPDPAEELATWRASAKVSRFQAFAALDAAGLLDDATALVTAQGGVAKLAWDNAIEFRRNSPTINGLASQLGLTDEQLDALFIAAAEIEA